MRSLEHDPHALRCVLGVDAPVTLSPVDDDTVAVSGALERQFEVIVFGARVRHSRRWRKPSAIERAYTRLASQRPPSVRAIMRYRETRWPQHGYHYHPLRTMVGRSTP